MRRDASFVAGAGLLGMIALVTLAAPALTVHGTARQFRDYENAPPMPPRIVDADGRLRAPFVYPVRLVDRLERRYVEDRATRVPLEWLSAGALVRVDERHGPWLLLGGDTLGRDVFARLVGGARLSLGVAIVAAAGALWLGALLGACAGYAGGRIDEALMRAADFVLLLPAIYLVLALRAAMPLVLSTAEVFWAVAGVLALAGWPYPARGVRAIVAAERRKEYAEAARAAGAGPVRILLRHLLPASAGFLALQATLLLPAFILAEATLSFVGLGFAEPAPSWGLMLQDAANVSVMIQAPWLLAPAAAIVISVLSVHLVAGSRAAAGGRTPMP
jgi:peptide/nickel transport system permease protein